jgi:hypothetical protein
VIDMAFLTRHQLYAWVWTEATHVIAQELNFSMPWVRSFCTRHEIPHPGRGHWRRSETGHARNWPALPDPERNPTFELEISEERAGQLDQTWTEMQAGRRPLGTPEREVAFRMRHPRAEPQTSARDGEQAASGHNPGAEPAACMVPDAATLARLARRYEWFRSQQRVLRDLQVAARGHDAVTVACVARWVEAGRAVLAAQDPRRQVIAWCAEVAGSAVASLWGSPAPDAPRAPPSPPAPAGDLTPPPEEPA